MARSSWEADRPDRTWLPPGDDLMRMAQTLECKPAQPVFQAGMPAEHLYLVQRGSVKLLQSTTDRTKDYILKVVGPGDLFGTEACFGSGIYRANALTIGPTRLLVIDRHAIDAYLCRHPKAALRLLHDVSEELELLEDRLVETAYDSGEKRLAGQLLGLLRKFGGSDNGTTHLSLNLTRIELAELVGLRPETTIRILSRWRDEGLLTEHDKLLVLRDRRRLERLAQVDRPELVA